LPLKTKFLEGEKKVLMAQQQKQTKQRQTEEVQARKNSILESLLDLAFQVAKNNHDYQIAEQKLKGELT